jgi:hypothetical protein
MHDQDNNMVVGQWPSISGNEMRYKFTVMFDELFIMFSKHKKLASEVCGNTVAYRIGWVGVGLRLGT